MSKDAVKVSIPLINIKDQYKQVQAEIEKEVLEILRSGWYILGPKGKEFEEEAAKYTGAKYALGVRSGTDALLLALKAIGIKEGDEVITTPFTFIATAEAISYLGAKPVFVDIEDKYFCIDPTKIGEKITDKTKAILPVHLYGHSVQADEISAIAKDHNLKVVGDACQSIGTEYKGKGVGGIFDAVCFSFFPTKNLGAAGEGGMVTTNDEEIYEQVKILRVHGMKVRYEHETIGYNARLDEIQSAILRIKLKKLPEWTKRRQSIAQKYINVFKDLSIETPVTAEYSNHVYHQFTIRTGQREKLLKLLEEKGVGTAIHYPKPLHLQPAYRFLGLKEGAYPVSEKVAAEIFSIPVYPELADEQVEYVIKAVTEGVTSI